MVCTPAGWLGLSLNNTVGECVALLTPFLFVGKVLGQTYKHNTTLPAQTVSRLIRS